MRARMVPLIMLSLITYALANFLGVAEFYFIFWLTVCVFAFSLISIICIRFSIKVKMKSDSSYCTRGESQKIETCIENRSIIPFVRVELFEKVSNLGSKSNTIKRTVLVLDSFSSDIMSDKIDFTNCGMYQVEIVKIRICDPFGIFRVGFKPKNISESIVCIPRQIEDFSESFAVGNATRSLLMQKTNEHEDLSEVHQFTDSDYVKNIHWKQSAKCGQLMASGYEKPKDNGALFLIDNETSQTCPIQEVLERGDEAGDFALSVVSAMIKKRRLIDCLILTRDGAQHQFMISNANSIHSAAVEFSELQPICGIKEERLGILQYIPRAMEQGNLIMLCAELTARLAVELVEFASMGIAVTVFYCDGGANQAKLKALGITAIKLGRGVTNEND